MSEGFWAAAEALLRDHELFIDRPAGSPHPDYPTTIYPVDYGELVGTKTIDGEGVDVFVGSGDPTSLAALLVIHDPVKNQLEPKLVVGAAGAEIAAIVDFLRNVMHLEVIRVDRTP